MVPLLDMEAPPPPQSSSKLMRTVSISVLVMSLPVLYVSFLHVPPSALFRDTTFWFLMSNSIIIVIAADSGMLFFRSSSSSRSEDDDCGGGVPFVVSSGAESAVLVQNQALVVMEHGDLSSSVIVAENDHAAYALVVREHHQGEQAPASGELIVSPFAAAGEFVSVKNVDDVGATVPAAARLRSRPMMTASRSLGAREERPATARTRRHGHGHRPSHSHSHALVPVQDKSVVAVSEEKKHLRRTATDSSRRPSSPPPEEESEYSRLSDEELNRRVEEFITKFNREIRLQVEKEEQAAAA